MSKKGLTNQSQVRNEFYRDTQGCVLVYDVTNRASFEALEGWLKESQEHGAEAPVRGLHPRMHSGVRCVTKRASFEALEG